MAKPQIQDFKDYAAADTLQNSHTQDQLPPNKLLSQEASLSAALGSRLILLTLLALASFWQTPLLSWTLLLPLASASSLWDHQSQALKVLEVSSQGIG